MKVFRASRPVIHTTVRPFSGNFSNSQFCVTSTRSTHQAGILWKCNNSTAQIQSVWSDRDRLFQHSIRSFCSQTEVSKVDLETQSKLARSYLFGNQPLENIEVENNLAFLEEFLQRASVVKDHHDVEKDFEKGFQMLQECAKNGHLESEFYIACIYLLGYHIPHNEETKVKGLSLLKELSKKMHVDSVYCLTRLVHAWSETEAESLSSFGNIKALADRGHVDALRYVADCYYHGNKTTRSKTKAIEYYHKAAEKHDKASLFHFISHCEDCGKVLATLRKLEQENNPEALFVLALFYLEGSPTHSIEQNPEKAQEYLIKANSLPRKVPEALAYQGICLWHGVGVTEDKKEAFNFFCQGAKLNNNVSQFYLGLGYFFGLPNVVEKNYQLAFQFFDAAASLAHFGAQYYLGLCYLYGLGCTKDVEKGVLQLGEAAKAENSDAQNLLGCFFYHGKMNIEQDYKKAFNLFNRAAEKDHPEALNHVAICYLHGYGVDVSPKKSVEYLQKAAALGNVAASCNLGVCYLTGRGVDQDYVKAYRLFDQHQSEFIGSLYFKAICMCVGKGTALDVEKGLELLMTARSQGSMFARHTLLEYQNNEESFSSLVIEEVANFYLKCQEFYSAEDLEKPVKS